MKNTIKPQQRFGRLTTIARVLVDTARVQEVPGWACRCDCGSEVIILSTNLLAGRTKSCGCLRRTNKEIIKRRLNTVMQQVRELAIVEGVNMRDEKARVEYLLSLLREK